MDKIQKILVEAGREDLAQCYYLKLSTVKLPKFDNEKDLANWIEKQEPGIRLKDDIIDQETGEVLFEAGQKLSKYQKQRLIGILTGKAHFEKHKIKEDPRDDFLNEKELKKYYHIFDKKDGKYWVSRSDSKLFEAYDESNIDSIRMDIENQNEIYEYGDYEFKIGKRFVKLIPIGLNKKYALDHFEDIYDIKYEDLGKWMEEEIFKGLEGEYSRDTSIPNEISKKDKSEITDDDYKIIMLWVKIKNKNLKDEGVEIFNWGKNPDKVTVTFEPSFIR